MSESRIAFSVIIPIYNAAIHIKECIESVLRQTFSDYEILLLNDGSFDESGILCEEYAKNDSRIRYVEQNHSGIAYTRDHGIRLANGEYLIFLDADDLWIDDRLLEKLRDICDRTQTDIIQFSFCSFYGTWRKNNSLYEKSAYSPKMTLENMLISKKHISTNLWTKAISNDYIKKNNLRFDLNLVTSEDTDFAMSMWSVPDTSVVIIDEKLYAHRIRSGSLSCAQEAVYDRMYLLEKWREYEYDERISEVLKHSIYGRMAYQYLIMLGTIPRIKNRDERIVLYGKSAEKKDILRYAMGGKCKVMALLCSVVGIKASAGIFYAVNLIRKR